MLDQRLIIKSVIAGINAGLNIKGAKEVASPIDRFVLESVVKILTPLSERGTCSIEKEYSATIPGATSSKGYLKNLEERVEKILTKALPNEAVRVGITNRESEFKVIIKIHHNPE
jgi:hypothetical protein